MEREYEGLVEQSFVRILKAAKDPKDGEERASNALKNAFASGRRSFGEQRLARALELAKSPGKATGKGAVGTKRAEKVGKK
jgi:hypothetical protein